jgi:hypothetical protein
MLQLHILIAVAGLISATYGVFSPSRTNIVYSFVFTALTVVTGTIMTIESPAHILQTCVTGLAYTALTTSGIFVAQRKLATQAVSIKK